MLSIYYGDYDRDDYIFDPDTYFNNAYEDEWITDALTVKNPGGQRDRKIDPDANDS